MTRPYDPCVHGHIGTFSCGCGIDVFRCDACGRRIEPAEAKQTFAIKRTIIALELNANGIPVDL